MNFLPIFSMVMFISVYLDIRRKVVVFLYGLGLGWNALCYRNSSHLIVIIMIMKYTHFEMYSCDCVTCLQTSSRQNTLFHWVLGHSLAALFQNNKAIWDINIDLQMTSHIQSNIVSLMFCHGYRNLVACPTRMTLLKLWLMFILQIMRFEILCAGYLLLVLVSPCLSFVY